MMPMSFDMSVSRADEFLSASEISSGSERSSESAVAGSAVAGFAAALTGACAVPLAETGWVRVTGEDRVRWLNGMVTNSIQALGPGDGCFNFLLNAQGRIQGTATAWAAGDAILLETDRAQVGPMMAMLDRFIIMDDVELADGTGERAGLLLAGPEAEALLRAEGLLPEALAQGAGVRFAEVAWRGAQVRVQTMPGKVVPRFELWATRPASEELRAMLAGAGVVEGDAGSVETLRLLEGTPRFGVDLREKELPQETGQTEALHFSKGCYLGQEIVERIRSRGAVHRVFAGFALEGERPAVGAVLNAGEKAVGEITSLGVIPEVPGRTAGRVMALGYVRREALETKGEIRYEGGTARPVSLPVALGSSA